MMIRGVNVSMPSSTEFQGEICTVIACENTKRQSRTVAVRKFRIIVPSVSLSRDMLALQLIFVSQNNVGCLKLFV